jgi:hypothetical protein
MPHLLQKLESGRFCAPHFGQASAPCGATGFFSENSVCHVGFIAILIAACMSCDFGIAVLGGGEGGKLSFTLSLFPSIINYGISNPTINKSALQYIPAAAGQHLYIVDISVATIATVK